MDIYATPQRKILCNYSPRVHKNLVKPLFQFSASNILNIDIIFYVNSSVIDTKLYIVKITHENNKLFNRTFFNMFH